MLNAGQRNVPRPRRTGWPPATAAAFLLLCTLPVTAKPQTAQDGNRLGLTCAKILAMTPEKWSEYYDSKSPGGEAGIDQAYEAYAGCMNERNDAAIARLPRQVGSRLRQYRALCGKFRIDNLELQQAYAGGGTLYGHAEPRGLVDDERLIERLAHVMSRRPSSSGGLAPKADLARIRRRLGTEDPSTAANRKRLAEFSTGSDAHDAYSAVRHDLAALTPLVTTERADAGVLVLKFLDAWSRTYGP